MKERSGMPYDVVAFSTDERAMMLSLEEEGAFHRLLRHAWINGSIPSDERQLALICRAITFNQMRKLWVNLQGFFKQHPEFPDRLVNPKQESEREFKQTKKEKAAESARKRWENKENVDANALRTHTERIATQHTEGNAPLPAPSPPHSVSTNVDTRVEAPKLKRKRDRRELTEPPEQMEFTTEMEEWALSNGFDDATVRRETAAMLDHFRGKGERKADWVATWRNWLRNSKKFSDRPQVRSPGIKGVPYGYDAPL